MELVRAPAADFAPTTPLVTTGGRTDAVERREAQRYGEARQRAVRQVVPSELHGRLSGYARAMRLLAEMNYTTEQYDGGDEEFWLRYFVEGNEPLQELPWRYHAHRLLPLAAAEWGKVRMMHLITNLAGRGWHIPKNVTARAEKYH